MKNTSNTHKSSNEINKMLCAGIIDVLENEWSYTSEFDHVWLGYNALYDTLKEKGFDCSIKDLKNSMKILERQGKVELAPLYDTDYKLCGRGWIACA